jgi:hypothetical protein
VGLYPVYPDCLCHGEFALLKFILEAQSACHLELDNLLGLRQSLRQSGCELFGARGAALFDAPLSTDPHSVRRHQKPAPGFVLHPDPAACGELLEGDQLELDCLFLGMAVALIGDFVQIVQHLGRRGLAGGNGSFELVAVKSLGADGCWHRLWSAVKPADSLAPDLVRLDHWLDRHWPSRLPVVLEIITPMRLLANGHLLRFPRFDQIFPFLLRRVTSMLQTYCELEVIEEPARLVSVARQTRASWSDRRWADWRETGSHGVIGGLLGALQIDTPELDELLWVLRLATLFGVGKGATYGAGRCRLLWAE